MYWLRILIIKIQVLIFFCLILINCNINRNSVLKSIDNNDLTNSSNIEPKFQINITFEDLHLACKPETRKDLITKILNEVALKRRDCSQRNLSNETPEKQSFCKYSEIKYSQNNNISNIGVDASLTQSSSYSSSLLFSYNWGQSTTQNTGTTYNSAIEEIKPLMAGLMNKANCSQAATNSLNNDIDATVVGDYQTQASASSLKIDNTQCITLDDLKRKVSSEVESLKQLCNQDNIPTNDGQPKCPQNTCSDKLLVDKFYQSGMSNSNFTLGLDSSNGLSASINIPIGKCSIIQLSGGSNYAYLGISAGASSCPKDALNASVSEIKCILPEDVWFTKDLKNLYAQDATCYKSNDLNNSLKLFKVLARKQLTAMGISTDNSSIATVPDCLGDSCDTSSINTDPFYFDPSG
jgi:hypothetical protein